MKTRILLAAAVALAFALGVFAGPPRDVAFDVRDVEAEDVQSVCVYRVATGWVEQWSFIAYTSGDVEIEPVTFEQTVTGPPDINQVNAMVTSRLNQLSARLDEKYPSSGPPQALPNGSGKGQGNGKP